MPITPESVGMSGFSMDPVKDLTSLVDTGYGIYKDQRDFKFLKDQYADKRKIMNQEYIANQRAMNRQKRIRDLMLGIPIEQVPAAIERPL